MGNNEKNIIKKDDAENEEEKKITKKTDAKE